MVPWKKVVTGLTSIFTPTFHYQLDLNSTAYIQKHTELAASGYRVNHIAGYFNELNETVYSAIWERPAANNPAPPRYAHHALTGPEYDDLAANLAAKDYHPLIVNGYNTEDGDVRFATVWEKSQLHFWHQERDLTKQQVQSFLREHGWEGKKRMTWMSGYYPPSTADDPEPEARYVVIAGDRTFPGWHGDWTWYMNRTYLDFRGDFAGDGGGTKPISLSLRYRNSEPRFDYIWQRYTRSGWDGMPQNWAYTTNTYADDYEAAWKRHVDAGKTPIAVTGYFQPGCGMFYVGIFVSFDQPDWLEGTD
jgi:hypothetical protein